MMDGFLNVVKIWNAVSDAESQVCFIQSSQGDGTNGSVLGEGNGAPFAPMLTLPYHLSASIHEQFKMELSYLFLNAMATMEKKKERRTDVLLSLRPYFSRGTWARTLAVAAENFRLDSHKNDALAQGAARH